MKYRAMIAPIAARLKIKVNRKQFLEPSGAPNAAPEVAESYERSVYVDVRPYTLATGWKL